MSQMVRREMQFIAPRVARQGRACYARAVYQDVQRLVPGGGEAAAALDGPLGSYIRSEYEPKGLYVFSKFWDGGMRDIQSSARQINSLADLANFKVRVAISRNTLDLFQTLGAAPTPLPGNKKGSPAPLG